MNGDDVVQESTTALLFSKGLDIETRTKFGMMPLDLIPHRFGPTKRCYLLSKGVAPTAKNNDRDTFVDLTIYFFLSDEKKVTQS